MRIVMPLFNFNYSDSRDFSFLSGKYILQRFKANDEMPTDDKRSEILGLFSEEDIKHIKKAHWVLVADFSIADENKCAEEINILLLSFKIYKSAPLFIKYRLCKEDKFLCAKIREVMQYVLREENKCQITFNDLSIINNGFLSLLEMDTISNRTHNVLYFLYRGFFSEHWIDRFILLMSALEALFSKEETGTATDTICSRISKLLNSKQGCSYKDIEFLYRIRSDMVHGRIKCAKKPRDLEQLYELEHVIKECMKKILDDKIYLIYNDIEKKEDYYNKLV